MHDPLYLISNIAHSVHALLCACGWPTRWRFEFLVTMADSELKRTFDDIRAFMLQVLQTAAQLAQASERPDTGYLASFLGSTSMIKSCSDVDRLTGVLQTRRTSMQQEEQSVQLQLLQLFLENAKCDALVALICTS